MLHLRSAQLRYRLLNYFFFKFIYSHWRLQTIYTLNTMQDNYFYEDKLIYTYIWFSAIFDTYKRLYASILMTFYTQPYGLLYWHTLRHCEKIWLCKKPRYLHIVEWLCVINHINCNNFVGYLTNKKHMV